MAGYRIHDSTGHWIARVFNAMRREFDKALKKKGVTVGEWAALAALHKGQCSTPSEIASFVDMDRAMVTRILDKLTDEKRLAMRELSPFDRRSFTVKLTPDGRRLTNALLKENKRINDEFLSEFNKTEIDKLNRMLRTMCENRSCVSS